MALTERYLGAKFTGYFKKGSCSLRDVLASSLRNRLAPLAAWNAEIDMLRYICASYQRAISHFRCVDSYSCLRIFSENTKFHWKLPVDQKLDFEQILQVEHILCSVSQFEVNFLMTHRPFKLASLSMARALLLWLKQLTPGCPDSQMSIRLLDCRVSILLSLAC